MILFFIILILIGAIVEALNAAVLNFALNPGIGAGAIGLISFLGFVQTLLQYGLGATFTALLYARLREIKEGVGVEDLASVFE